MAPLILNVDDREISRYTRTRALQPAGFEVQEAASGEEALALVRRTRPDAVLLDVALPDLDGFAVAERIRQTPEGRDVAVVFISAVESSPAALSSALDDGANAYLVEPVDRDVLVSTLRAAIRRRALERELRSANALLERELAERAKLVEEHARYRRTFEALLEFIPDGITIADAPDVKIRWVSRYGRELTGRPRSEIEQISVSDHAEHWGILHADGVSPATSEQLPLARATLNGEVVQDEEWILRRPDGSSIWISCNAGPIRDEAGRITGGLIAWRDVSRRKAQQRALEGSQARLQLALTAAHLALWEYDPAAGVVHGCERMRVLFGIDGSAPADAWIDRIHPDDREQVKARWEAAIRRETRYECEYRVPLPDGDLTWVRAAGEMVELGGTERLVGIAEDITARKRAEEALQETQGRLVLAQTVGGVGTWFLDLRSGRFAWSQGMFRLWGLDEGVEAPEFERSLTLVHPEDRDLVRSAMETAASGGPAPQIEFRVTLPGGEVRWLCASGMLERDRDGRPARVMGVNYDITARRRAEEALRRSNEELQQFSYAVSHDLQEPLRTIHNFSELLRRKFASTLPEDARQYLAMMEDAAARMRRLITDLLGYSRVVEAPDAESCPVDMNQVAGWTLSNLKASIEENGATVETARLPVVFGSFSRLAQLMQNLVGNAIKYRKEGTAPWIRLLGETHGSECWFAIEDNGPGIPPDQAERVFLAFKRLHGREVSGSGLGLAIAKRIVEQHGGRIWVEASSLGGARFCFTLPAAEGRFQAAAES